MRGCEIKQLSCFDPLTLTLLCPSGYSLWVREFMGQQQQIIQLLDQEVELPGWAIAGVCPRKPSFRMAPSPHRSATRRTRRPVAAGRPGVSRLGARTPASLQECPALRRSVSMPAPTPGVIRPAARAARDDRSVDDSHHQRHNTMHFIIMRASSAQNLHRNCGNRSTSKQLERSIKRAHK